MKKLILKLIDIYQKGISPNSPPRCRFIPTCSQYAKESYETHNFFKATFLTLWRLIRCNPFCKGGYDPVPLKKEKKKRIS